MATRTRPTTHAGVQAGIEVLAGRALGRQVKQYRRDVAPLLAAIRGAKSPKGIRRAMSAALVKRMGTEAVSTALGETMMQVDLIARTEATPRMMQEGTQRRQDAKAQRE